MKYPEAIKNLENIIEESNYTRRYYLLKQWIKEYIHYTKNTQLTICTKKTNLENHDFICETVAHNCIDKLIEDKIVQFSMNKHSYSAEIWAIKHKKSLNHEE